MQTDAPLKKAGGRLSREDQRRLGDILQRAYDDVIRQGVPERFRELLDRLDSGGTHGEGTDAPPSPDGGHDDLSHRAAAGGEHDPEDSQCDRLMEAKPLHRPGSKGSN
jgi:hypothetical protein